MGNLFYKNMYIFFFIIITRQIIYYYLVPSSLLGINVATNFSLTPQPNHNIISLPEFDSVIVILIPTIYNNNNNNNNKRKELS